MTPTTTPAPLIPTFFEVRLALRGIEIFATVKAFSSAAAIEAAEAHVRRTRGLPLRAVDVTRMGAVH